MKLEKKFICACPKPKLKWRRVAEESLFGENWAKIDVRTFARIKKVIWDQLLATKAEIIQSIFGFHVKRDKVNIFSGKISLFRFFPLGVVRSPRRLFFRLNHLRIV